MDMSPYGPDSTQYRDALAALKALPAILQRAPFMVRLQEGVNSSMAKLDARVSAANLSQSEAPAGIESERNQIRLQESGGRAVSTAGTNLK